MTVKLRPGTHYVPVERGVLIAHRQTSFVLRGPAALYQLLDDSLGLLLDGTDAAALTRAAGDPAAAPVFEHIISTLLKQDVLFDVDAGSPLPGAADARRFARTLSYCEAQCSDPYGAFAAVRSARVTVLGSGPGTEPVIRALAEMGIGEVTQDEFRLAGSTLAVLIGEAALPAGAGPLRVVPVLPGPEVAVIGPLSPASGDGRSASIGWSAALARRAGRWVKADPSEAASPPLSAALAGSLAARAVLDHLLGLAAEPDQVATVVSGRLLTTTAVTRPAVLAGTVPAPAGLQGSLAGELLAGTASMTSPFRGPIRRGADDDLVQLPLSLASAQVVDAPAGPLAVLGWGTDRGSAGLDSVLRASRAWIGVHRGDAGPAAAAGLSSDGAELDGRLRVLGAELLTGPSGPPLGWSQLGASRPRALWSLVEDHYRRSVRMHARVLGDGPWTLVSVLGDGEPDVHHWGFSLDSAAFAALGQYAARLQVDPAQAQLLAAEPIGTQVLSWASPQQLAAGLAATAEWAGAAGRSWHRAWTTADEVSGPLPLYAGAVWAC